MNQSAFSEKACLDAIAAWGATAGTPLWNGCATWQATTRRESGVALRLPPHSKTGQPDERVIE
jgi:hypothetical protein